MKKFMIHVKALNYPEVLLKADELVSWLRYY
jgi:hypothetical protein